MTKFLNQINEQNLEIVCILIAVVAILLAIIVILDTLAKRKKERRHEIAINQTLSNIEEQVENIASIQEESVQNQMTNEERLSRTEPIEEIKYVEENSEEEKTKAKLELQNLKETLMKTESLENMEIPKQEIEDKALPVRDENKEKLVEYPKEEINPIKEEIQKVEIKQESPDINKLSYDDEEENAIISIDELKKASLNAYSDEEMYNYDDEGNEPISIQELEILQNTIKMKALDEIMPLPKEVLQEPQPAYYEKADNTFQKTPYISPIYGIKKTEESIALDQTANYDKLNEEIRRTTEFLAALKELRKNLD